mmetsp:Transcript_7956/g.25018  ORF Transcript_7956/g.25018 Transcript_7956/m.25018 type:complete len:291 (-) Transcript_7956:1370-2242(-)
MHFFDGCRADAKRWSLSDFGRRMSLVCVTFTTRGFSRRCSVRDCDNNVCICFRSFFSSSSFVASNMSVCLARPAWSNASRRVFSPTSSCETTRVFAACFFCRFLNFFSKRADEGAAYDVSFRSFSSSSSSSLSSSSFATLCSMAFTRVATLLVGFAFAFAFSSSSSFFVFFFFVCASFNSSNSCSNPLTLFISLFLSIVNIVLSFIATPYLAFKSSIAGANTSSASFFKRLMVFICSRFSCSKRRRCVLCVCISLLSRSQSKSASWLVFVALAREVNCVCLCIFWSSFSL